MGDEARERRVGLKNGVMGLQNAGWGSRTCVGLENGVVGLSSPSSSELFTRD